MKFNNPHAVQPWQWILRSTAKQPVTGVTVEINGQPAVDLKDRPLPPGGSLKYNGGAEAVICDAAWKELGRVAVVADSLRARTGDQQVKIACAPQAGATLKMELRTLGPATPIGGGRAGSH
jgi:hypothetical protein